MAIVMVSVIITTYKRNLNILSRAINSVLCQTFRDFEIIVIDDNYSESSFRKDNIDYLSELCSLNSRVKYHCNEKNMGANYSRNLGLSLANGDFVAFLDDDDEWLPEKLSKQIKKFDECGSDVGLVYCGAYFVNEISGTKTIKKTVFKRGYLFDVLILEKNIIGGMSFPLIKRQVFYDVGNFDEKMLAQQDLDFYLRMNKKYAVDFVSEPLLNYYIHDGEQITSNPKKVIQGRICKLEKYMDYFSLHKYAYWYNLMLLAYAYSLDNNKVQAISVWKDAVKVRKFSFFRNFKYLASIIYHLWRKK